MRSSSWIFASLFLLGACGGSSTTTDGGTDASADATGGDAARDATTMDLGGDALVLDLGGDAMLGDGGPHAPMYHRPDDSTCTAAAPPGTCTFGGGGPGGCTMDSDCTDNPGGRCNMNNGGAVFCFCSYDTCATDTDCPSGQTCACHGAEYHGAGNECIPSGCRVDADCGASGFCSPSRNPMGCGGLGGYFCHTAADTCTDDRDCTTGLMGCEYDATLAHWRCQDLLFCP